MTDSSLGLTVFTAPGFIVSFVGIKKKRKEERKEGRKEGRRNKKGKEGRKEEGI